MKHVILANPVSGNRKGKRHGIAVQKILKKNGINSELILSEYPGHLTNIAKEFSEKENCRFYVIGGDGTLNEVVTGMLGTDSEIVVIPSGTGNDFIKNVSKYMSLRKIVNLSINAKSKKVDIIKINNNKYCVNVLNAGFDAMVAKNVDLFRKVPFLSGKGKYNLSIFYTLMQNKNFKFKIRCDNDNILKGMFTLIAICNGKFYGGGVSPCKEADISDGLLNACIIDSTRVRQKIVLLPKYKKGEHYGLKQAHIVSSKSFSIVSTKNFPVSIDGEMIYTNRLKATILEKAINVVFIEK